jgi:hypothetical protein
VKFEKPKDAWGLSNSDLDGLELEHIKVVIHTARVDYIAGEDMEPLLHKIFEAAGFDPLYNFEEEVP